jgi:hypothetical protein
MEIAANVRGTAGASTAGLLYGGADARLLLAKNEAELDRRIMEARRFRGDTRTARTGAITGIAGAIASVSGAITSWWPILHHVAK